MIIIYLGDIMAKSGVEIVEKLLPSIRKKYKPDMVVAQAENVTEGRGMSVQDMRHLQSVGIDFFTGGNWSSHRKELHKLLEDPNEPVIGPINMHDSAGKGWKFFETPKGRVLMVSLLGSTVGREINTDNPLSAIDEALNLNKNQSRVATIVNFHGDYSSEKRIIGYYLDGRVSAVIGDHWHVPTADAMILPKGTAHITDVGMCGSLHSSLGVTLQSVIPRWRDGIPTKNEMSDTRPFQLNGVVVDVDDSTGLARSIVQIQQILAQ